MSSYVKIGNILFETLIAISQEEQATGLMNKNWPPPIMSFVYASSRINKFWMANTPSPLDILFCNNGKIINICYGEPFSIQTIGSDNKSDLVVELPFGTCAKYNIAINDPVVLIKK